MRIAIAIFAASLAVQALPAMAYENFIPLGHNYAPDNSELPTFDSDRDKLNAQVDIFEAEIYTRQRAAKSFSSQLNQFSSEQELKGGSEFIDY